jgi:hypothetical protein
VSAIFMMSTDADGLDEHPAVSGGGQQLGDLARRARQPAKRAAGGHAADEDARIERVRLHPDAVAEHGPARERARRIHGHNPNGFPLRAQERDEPVHHRGLARAGRAGDPDHVGAAGARVDRLHDGGHRVAAIFDVGDEPREGEPVATQHARDERGGVGAAGSRFGSGHRRAADFNM